MKEDERAAVEQPRCLSETCAVHSTNCPSSQPCLWHRAFTAELAQTSRPVSAVTYMYMCNRTHVLFVWCLRAIRHSAAWFCFFFSFGSMRFGHVHIKVLGSFLLFVHYMNISPLCCFTREPVPASSTPKHSPHTICLPSASLSIPS